jgi:hypothetical protein
VPTKECLKAEGEEVMCIDKLNNAQLVEKLDVNSAWLIKMKESFHILEF